MTTPAPTTSSTPSRGRVFLPVLILLGVMWVMEFLDFILPADLDYWGIRSRDPEGLLGIPMAPFLHGGFEHLMANTLPFLILGTLVAWRAGGKFWSVAIIIIVLGGAGVWLFGPGNVITIGASGLVFGFLGYLLVLGILTRSWVDILVSVGVLLIYGSLLLGATPFGVPEGVSWLAHLTGFVAGVVAAFVTSDRSVR
ncbi:MAG: rhomboid family intramembrane serine protease [Candidatus Nanopelagicales bacterium]